MNKRDVISPITVSPGVAVLVPTCPTHNVDHPRATGHPTHLQTSYYPFPLSHIFVEGRGAIYLVCARIPAQCTLTSGSFLQGDSLLSNFQHA